MNTFLERNFKRIIASLGIAAFAFLGYVIESRAQTPVNCATSFLTYTAATHSYTCGSAALTYSGAAVTLPSLTSGRVPYAGTGGLVSDSANLTWDNTNVRLTVGSGSTTSAGWILGYSGTSGQATMYWTGDTPSSSNYRLFASAGGTLVNAPSGNLIFQTTGTNKANFTSTAGDGLYITAGTATTDVAALSVTRTNNNAAVATGVKFAFTDTTSAAGFEPFGVYGGASATTQLFSVNKAGTTTSVRYVAAQLTASSAAAIGSDFGSTVGLYLKNSANVEWSSTSSVGGTPDSNLSRVSAGVVGVGTGAAGSFAGTLKLTTLQGGTSITINNAASGSLTIGSNAVTPASSGTRYLCIDTSGVISSSALACSGT